MYKRKLSSIRIPVKTSGEFNSDYTANLTICPICNALHRRDEKLDTLVESVPRVMLIVDTVRRELNSAGMTPKSLAGCVVRNVGPAAMENLINSPVLCWNLVRNPKC